MASFVSEAEANRLLAEKNAAYVAWQEARKTLEKAEADFNNAREAFYEAAERFDNSHD